MHLSWCVCSQRHSHCTFSLSFLISWERPLTFQWDCLMVRSTKEVGYYLGYGGFESCWAEIEEVQHIITALGKFADQYRTSIAGTETCSLLHDKALTQPHLPAGPRSFSSCHVFLPYSLQRGTVTELHLDVWFYFFHGMWNNEVRGRGMMQCRKLLQHSHLLGRWFNRPT